LALKTIVEEARRVWVVVALSEDRRLLILRAPHLRGFFQKFHLSLWFHISNKLQLPPFKEKEERKKERKGEYGRVRVVVGERYMDGLISRRPLAFDTK